MVSEQVPLPRVRITGGGFAGREGELMAEIKSFDYRNWDNKIERLRCAVRLDRQGRRRPIAVEVPSSVVELISHEHRWEKAVPVVETRVSVLYVCALSMCDEVGYLIKDKEEE